jgi:azurin
VTLAFPSRIDRETAAAPRNHFAQAWNYQYAGDYGSPEFSVNHPGVPGHDPLEIRSAHVLNDGTTLFLEIPQLRPVHQLHLRIRIGGPRPLDVFATVHALAPAFTDFPGYTPVAKTATAAAPLVADVAPAVKNPWTEGRPGRPIRLEAALGLQFATKRLSASPGEQLSLTFVNPDFVPHNFVLVKPGAMPSIGASINKLIAEPGAAARHYLPDSSDILLWTDMVNPRGSTTVHFAAPAEKGEFPFLCSFPGHWQVMNGLMIVK